MTVVMNFLFISVALWTGCTKAPSEKNGESKISVKGASENGAPRSHENDGFLFDEIPEIGDETGNAPKNMAPLPVVGGTLKSTGFLLEKFPEIGDDIETEAGKITIISRHGSGGYGEVLEGFWKEAKKKVAVKITRIGRSMRWNQEIERTHELEVLKVMNKTRGFPLLFAGETEGEFPYIVMQHVGTDLYRISRHAGGNFPLAILPGVIEKVVVRLKFLHEKGFLMNDLHFRNMCTQWDHNSMGLYLIDFGLAIPYRVDGKHIPRDQECGTPNRESCSRRDELLALLKRILNAYAITVRYDADFESICTAESMWLLPAYRYLRTLDFEADPNYEHFSHLLLSNYETAVHRVVPNDSF